LQVDDHVALLVAHQRSDVERGGQVGFSVQEDDGYAWIWERITSAGILEYALIDIRLVDASLCPRV
jgi:hypothetical protein